ncbi:hypothetical protein [Mucilaginibacter flavus]|uniref:hypothetical protein n=1 Tax=Mucilaginibacter flavus TaxID=931504 RepID=UPI0025B49ADE|nr:hypothetical protein [Mucilaginibacter flavus]MDN3580009.1 hypothetical protein [Mucilaginibacter flavus]
MKKIKTLLLLAATLGVITLNSCSKDKNSVPSATITAGVDGTATTFNTNAITLSSTVNGATFTNIQGTASNGATISITLSGKPTAGKTYISTASKDDDKPVMLYSLKNDNYFNDDDNTKNIVSVTISSVSSTGVQGTFKGALTNTVFVGTGGGTAKTKAITDGKFNVYFSK